MFVLSFCEDFDEVDLPSPFVFSFSVLCGCDFDFVFDDDDDEELLFVGVLLFLTSLSPSTPEDRLFLRTVGNVTSSSSNFWNLRNRSLMQLKTYCNRNWNP